MMVMSEPLPTMQEHPAVEHQLILSLVEKFNSTLISMLSKSVEKYGHDWDAHLPYVLFAY